MKISIITVCFNSADTIENTIRSVLSQTYGDIEYIVIDGQSTDNTLAIIQKYQSQIDHIVSEPDSGLYDAMNKGIKLSTGDVVGILNSDDVFFDKSVVAKIAQEIDGVDAVYGDVAFYDSQQFKKIVRYYSSKGFHPEKMARGIMPAHPSLYVKRHKLVNAGLYDTRYKIASDFDMILKMFSEAGFSYNYIPQVFVKMLVGGLSTSGIKSNWLLNKEIKSSCERNGIKTSWLKILSKYPEKLLGYVAK